MKGMSEGMILFRSGDKYGFAGADGTAVIGPRFSDAGLFREGLAQVKLDGGWGFIDMAGRFAVEPRFEDALFFSEGLAAVKTGGKWGYIDKNGDTAMYPRGDSWDPALLRKYEWAESLGDGVCLGKLRLPGDGRDGMVSL